MMLEKSTSEVASLARSFWKPYQVTRDQIFNSEKPQLPTSLVADAHVPWAGFAGTDYREGGDMFLGINPGGGSPGYTCRTAEDEHLFPKLAAFQNVSESLRDEAYLDLVSACSEVLPKWNIWLLVDSILKASRQTLSSVCFVNWCPFRTLNNNMPYAAAMRRSHQLVLHPLLGELKPKRIFALGKKAGDNAEKYGLGENFELHIFPRTNGDRYIAKEAAARIEEIRTTTGCSQ